ncbi:MAG: hypothetical protein HYU87_10010 [Chloroflexi bacterium]|nr:hypothetical protein [Chloroflexota bacterium]
MSALVPYMGERRASEISGALGAYRPIRVGPFPATCVVPACGAAHEARGLCHRHHMQWWRDTRRARLPRVVPLH